MKNVFEDFLKMPYFQNYAASSGRVHNVAKHEDAVEDILIKHQLQKEEISVPIKIRDGWLQGCANPLPDNCYISQPCGTHNSPDFIVKKGGKLYFLECKSVKGGTPMYNSGVPKDNYIYILTSKRHNRTTLYRGRDVLPDYQARLIYEHISHARDRDAELNAKLQSNGHGISYYTRPMIQHKGSKVVKDYFVNTRRAELERNALELGSV
jgi:hypothetical protein